MIIISFSILFLSQSCIFYLKNKRKKWWEEILAKVVRVYLLRCEGGEAEEQAAQRRCGCLITGSAQGPAQPDRLGGVTAWF